MTAQLTAFLAARLDDDERVALAASGEYSRQATTAEHWRWECCEDDQPLDVDLAIASGQEFLEHDEHWRVGLRSTETYPSAHVGELEHLVISDEEVTPQVARHLARYDPARALREVAAKRAIVGSEDDGLALYVVHERGVWPDELTRAAEQILRRMAAVYSDHPGYLPDWRPA